MADENSSPRAEKKEYPIFQDRDYEKCGCEIGCGSCRTKRCTIGFLGCFANIKFAVFLLALVSFLEGLIVNGLYNVSITNLERRFNLRSEETGLIASCFDIGLVLCLPVVTYIGGRGNKPQWLGWGVFIMGLGSIVFSLPHFIAPRYVFNSIESCNTSSECVEDLRAYRGFFILGQLLHGIGASPILTLGITYIDENVKQIHSSVYNGVFYAITLTGPGVGYIVGGSNLRTFTTFETVSITQNSPLWVGAWWLGFLIFGCITILVSIPLLMYPRQLPGTDEVRVNRETEMHQSKDAIQVKGDEDFGKRFRDAPRCFLVIAKNPVVMLISFSASLDTGLIISLALFGPKYIESMFALSASDAGLYFGILAIVASLLAQLLGGIIVWKLKLTVSKMLLMNVVCSFISFLCLFVFLIKCQDHPIVGVSEPYHNETGAPNCAEGNCRGCKTEYYNPVCGADNSTYLSECDAQCAGSINFENCTRILQSTNIATLSAATATAGVCKITATCPSSYQQLFLVFAALSLFFKYLKSQPGLQSTLRCVPFSQRSFTIGIQWFIIRVCGTIPWPIIFGAILDSSCRVWGEQCGQCGACKVYNNENLATYLTVLSTVISAATVMIGCITWKVYKPPPPEDDEGDDGSPQPTTGRNAVRLESEKDPIDTAENRNEYINPSFSEK